MIEPVFVQLIKSIQSSFLKPNTKGCLTSQSDAHLRLVAIRDSLNGLIENVESHHDDSSAASLELIEARNSRLQQRPVSREQTLQQIVGYFNGLPDWSHRDSQTNIDTPSTIPSMLAELMSAIWKPNLCDQSSSHRIGQAEVEAIAITADLLGYDTHRCSGLFTFGGTGTLLYGIRVGLEKACKGIADTGLTSEEFDRSPVVIGSAQAHHANLTAAQWLGIGRRNVKLVPTNSDDSICLKSLEQVLADCAKKRLPIAAIIATIGTTNVFAIDGVAEILSMRDRIAREYDLEYSPHIHADAVIGWAWSVFRDYAWTENPLQFERNTINALSAAMKQMEGLQAVDSIGVDFHKFGFTPYNSSLFLCRESSDLQVLGRDSSEMPYLFRSGEYHPGKVSLETSRSGMPPLVALTNLRLFGKQGMQSLIGQCVSIALGIRQKLAATDGVLVLNAGSVGPVILFQVHPLDADSNSDLKWNGNEATQREQLSRLNEYQRQLQATLLSQGEFQVGLSLSLTERRHPTLVDEPMLALKCYVSNPFVEPDHIEYVISCLTEARRRLARC
jgi:L-2,4-diaminobutyrate decarboxylase